MKSITIRLDDQLKSSAESVLDALGVSPTQAITQLYQYVAEHGRLPFRQITRTESPEDVVYEALRRTTLAHDALIDLQHTAPEKPGYDAKLRTTAAAISTASGYVTANLNFMAEFPATEKGKLAHVWSWSMMATALQDNLHKIAGADTGRPTNLDISIILLTKHLHGLKTWLNGGKPLAVPGETTPD